VTNYSRQVASYDWATELENIGGEIIELRLTDWKALTEER
jgi:hypothetical protein